MGYLVTGNFLPTFVAAFKSLWPIGLPYALNNVVLDGHQIRMGKGTRDKVHKEEGDRSHPQFGFTIFIKINLFK